MKAMIFAAGFGTRLGEITKTTPKCLVEVDGQTMLDHVVDRLIAAGVTSVVINLHHLGDKVERHVRDRKNFGIEVTFSPEYPNILETGGGLKAAESFLKGEECFFVHNADVYSTTNLTDVLTHHRSSHAIATLVVMNRKSSRHLLFSPEGNLVGHEGKAGTPPTMAAECATPIRRAFSGIHCISPEIFEYMRGQTGAFSIIKTYLSAAAAGKTVRAYNGDNDFWVDVGTPAELDRLRTSLLQKRTP